jgi:hypothetical protein
MLIGYRFRLRPVDHHFRGGYWGGPVGYCGDEDGEKDDCGQDHAAPTPPLERTLFQIQRADVGSHAATFAYPGYSSFEIDA